MVNSITSVAKAKKNEPHDDCEETLKYGYQRGKTTGSP